MVKRDPDCSLCGLCEFADHICLLGHGPDKCDVMIIGEAPGRTEDETGLPFQGRSGQLLDDMLGEAGIDRESVYITNAVHCRPPDNRVPGKKEITACYEWLLKEIRQVKPKFIMTLGNIPLQAITGQKGIKNLRGKPIEIKIEGTGHDVIYLFPAYHPSYALRDPRNEPVLRRDIAQFFNIVKRGSPRHEKGLNYRIVQTPDEYAEALAAIKEEDVLAYDCETSGLDQFAPGGYITSIGIATSDTQWCFPLQHSEGRHVDKSATQKRLLKKIVNACKGKTMVGHNGKFDTIWIKAICGSPLYCDFDTMLAHYQLDENAHPGHDQLASQYFGAIDSDIPLKQKHGFGPLKRHCEYLALDIYYTRKLYYILKKELKGDANTKRVFDGITMPVARMYSDTEFTGVYVDPHRLVDAQRYWSVIEEESLKELNRLVPGDNQYKDKKTKKVITGVNWASPDQVAEVLFKKLGLTPLDMTPGGKSGNAKPSVSESVLTRLKDQHAVPQLIVTLREAQKNRGTFIEGWQKRCYDGERMHPTFKVHGTVTGRPSCAEPNLQQTPRDKRLRSLITAPDGWTLVDADLSQAELRITAEMSDDPALKMSYQTGVDVHTLTVQRIFGIEKPNKEERKKGKAINFGFVYGMGWKKFKLYARDNYGVDFTDAECKKIRKHFFQLYAGLPAWHARQRMMAKRNGYVRSILGRKRRLPDAQMQSSNPMLEMRQAEAERQAINSPVQSFASDLNLLAAVQLHEEFKSTDYFRMIGTIHDAILMEVRDDKLDYVLPKIKAAMEMPQKLKEWNIRLSVPIVSEIECGPWGDAKVWSPS